MDKNEKSTTIDATWWEKNTEVQHIRIIDELQTKNWRIALREIFAYLRFLQKEYVWIEDLACSVLQHFEEAEAGMIQKEWAEMLGRPN